MGTNTGRSSKQGLPIKSIATAAAVLACGAAGCGEAPPVSDTASSYHSRESTPEAVAKAASVMAATGKLADPARTWSLAVLGDSTGDAPDEWVYLLAEKLSAAHGRPVTVHDWSAASNAYWSATPVGDGRERAPIEIWNASAAGRTFEYSYLHREAALPKQPDLVILNHGHNLGDVQEAHSGSRQLVDWITSNWDTSPAIAITLQNPRTDAATAKHEQVVAALRKQWGNSDVSLIDVHAAFLSSPAGISALLQKDGLHPSGEGEAVWAETVASDLGLLTATAGK